CESGQGIGQALELYVQPYLTGGMLIQVLEEWSEERFPLYAYHPSRRHPSAKVRAFLEFAVDLAR
ncbi:MAG TPA: LysR substrate-binding domain-containing protein, partial [Stellaceae bacterium]